MSHRWITGDSFFMPVTRARPGWRPWVPVVLLVGAFAAVLYSGFHGLTPVEFDTDLLPESCRITYTLDRSHSHAYDVDDSPLIVWPDSAHDVYFRFHGTRSQLAGELAESSLAYHYYLCRGEDLTYVREDGRVVLTFSGGDSVFPWDRTSYMVHTEKYSEPQAEYLREAGL